MKNLKLVSTTPTLYHLSHVLPCNRDYLPLKMLDYTLSIMIYLDLRGIVRISLISPPSTIQSLCIPGYKIEPSQLKLRSHLPSSQNIQSVASLVLEIETENYERLEDWRRRRQWHKTTKEAIPVVRWAAHSTRQTQVQDEICIAYMSHPVPLKQPGLLV